VISIGFLNAAAAARPRHLGCERIDDFGLRARAGVGKPRDDFLPFLNLDAGGVLSMTGSILCRFDQFRADAVRDSDPDRHGGGRLPGFLLDP